MNPNSTNSGQVCAAVTLGERFYRVEPFCGRQLEGGSPLQSPRESACHPKTLVRAARDQLKSQPAFALDVALAALYWMARGEGYDLTGADVAAAGDHAAAAAAALGTGALVRERIAASVAGDGPAARWARQCLGFDAGR